MSKTYKFSTFQELVDRVPGDRILVCMKELGAMLGTAKLTTELTHMVAEDLAKKDGKEFPPMPESIIKLPDFFEWVDDGKGDCQANMIHPETGKNMFSVKLKMKEERTP